MNLSTLKLARILVAAWLGTCVIDAQAAQVEAPYMTATRYNPAGQVTGTLAPDPDGGGSLRLLATRNTYTNGLLTKTESGELSAWQPETTDPNSWSSFTIFSTTFISYDSYGRKIQETLQGRNGSTVESVMEYSYDSAGHVQCKAVRLSRTASGNACAQGTQSSDGPDRIDRYTYDTLDQVLTEERGVGTSLDEVYVTNTYSSHLLTSQKDANNNLTQLTYDSYGRLQYRYYPSATTPGSYNSSDYNYYAYDGNGNVTTERKRNNTYVYNTYDADNRLIKKDLSDNTYAQDVYYDYDARGLMLHAAYGSDSGQGIYTTYDGFGHVATSTNTMGGVSRTLSYQYDNNGNRTRITHPDAYFFQYGFDGLNRINALGESAGANPAAGTNPLLTVGYQPNGSVDNISRNGAVSKTTLTPDDANRVMTLTHDLAGTANDLTNTFTYNAANQITQLTQSNTAYSYTGNDNKTGAYTPDGLNRYTTINGQAISYDLNQNLTSDGLTNYTYDMENHLVATSGSVVSSFVYDPMGRLFQATIAGATTQFLWDNNALVAEYVSGTISKRYVHGDQVDEPLVQYNGATVNGPARIYLHADHQGSIIAQSDYAGNAITKYTYDNYGIPGNAADYRFGYTGQLWFKALKLNYYKARWYSPYLGRFMQTDPIFYKDDMDLYSYVGNDPMDGRDPTGNSGLPDWLNEYIGDVKATFPTTLGEFAEAAGEAVQALPMEGAIEQEGAMAVKEVAETVKAETRATEIAGTMSARTQRSVTIAVTETKEGTRVVSSSEGALRPAARDALQAGEVEGKGAAGTHAEINGINAANDKGLTPTGTAASRPICSNCAANMSKQGVKPLSPLKPPPQNQ